MVEHNAGIGNDRTITVNKAHRVILAKPGCHDVWAHWRNTTQRDGGVPGTLLSRLWSVLNAGANQPLSVILHLPMDQLHL